MTEMRGGGRGDLHRTGSGSGEGERVSWRRAGGEGGVRGAPRESERGISDGAIESERERVRGREW